MIEISNDASHKLFETVERNLKRFRGYGSPPIFYWYRNVVEALKLIWKDENTKEGNYQESLENSLGEVFYSIRYANNEAIYIITDFKFNGATIRVFINRARLSRRGVNIYSRPLYTSPSSQPIKTVNIGYGIVCSEYQDGSIWLSYKGTSLKSQFDKMLKNFCRWRDGIYAVFEKDGVRYKLFRNDTVQRINENRQQTLRLTEAQFKRMLTECITKIITESKGHVSTKKIGKYKAIDGSWWDSFPQGLEQFGSVQDVRMYDNTEKKGEEFETIGLFRQISSRKFFYAKIVPIKGSKETRWNPIHKEEVPSIILNDLKTINFEGHEPYLPL